MGNVEISACESSWEGPAVPACHPAARSVLSPVLVVSVLLALSCTMSPSALTFVYAPAASSIDPGRTVLVPRVAFLAVAVLLAQWAARGKEREVLADFSLHGRGRARAYLMGRGLPELETDVTILTALGFSSTSVAASLCVSSQTVSQHRPAHISVLAFREEMSLEIS